MKKGAPKPKNMKKTLMSLLKYVGRYKVLLSLVIIMFNASTILDFFTKKACNHFVTECK